MTCRAEVKVISALRTEAVESKTALPVSPIVGQMPCRDEICEHSDVVLPFKARAFDGTIAFPPRSSAPPPASVAVRLVALIVVCDCGRPQPGPS